MTFHPFAWFISLIPIPRCDTDTSCFDLFGGEY